MTSTDQKPLGARARGPSTLLLRARDVLGNDCRSFLIVELIASPRGVRLREVSKRTGYTYRSLSEAASGWQASCVVRIDRGYCVLNDAAPWSELLRCHPEEIVTVDWHAAYGAVLARLRTLQKARSLGLDPESALVAGELRVTDDALAVAGGGVARSRTPALDVLRSAVVSDRA